MRKCNQCSAEISLLGSCTCGNCGALNFVDDSAHPQKDKKMPSMFKQAKNFATSAARHIANGGQNVPENLKNARLEICGGCDKLSGDKCSACGCLVSIKAAWASEECPIGKWERYEQTRGKCGGCGGK